MQMLCRLPVIHGQYLAIFHNLAAIHEYRLQGAVTGCVDQAANGVIGRADHGVRDIHQGEIRLAAHRKPADVIPPKCSRPANGRSIE